MADYAIYYDSSLCTNCKGCQVACKCWNNLPSPTGLNENKWSGSLQNPIDLNGDTRLIQTFSEQHLVQIGNKPINWVFTRRSCQHCGAAPCAKVCPTGCLSKDPETGFVTVDDDKCIGCMYCSAACPFDVPHYFTDPGSPLGMRVRVNKCTACIDRVHQGLKPACVSTCQPEALEFGPRDDMIAKGKDRVEKLKERGYTDAELYGEKQVGGLHVISVLKYGAKAHGKPTEFKGTGWKQAQQIIKPITGLISGVVVLGLGAMFCLGIGYKRDTLVYNEDTDDTISMNTGKVVKHGDGQDEKSVMEHITENLPIMKGGKDE